MDHSFNRLLDLVTMIKLPILQVTLNKVKMIVEVQKKNEKMKEIFSNLIIFCR